MTYKDLAQFKFSSGAEIVCEVMEWADEEAEDIIIRNAMSIVMGETPDGERIYMFRPWVHYLDKQDEYIVINPSHIISQNRPNKYLIKEYEDAVITMQMQAREREEEYVREEKQNLAKLQKAMTNYVNKKTVQEDFEQNNVVKFPSKDDTVH